MRWTTLIDGQSLRCVPAVVETVEKPQNLKKSTLLGPLFSKVFFAKTPELDFFDSAEYKKKVKDRLMFHTDQYDVYNGVIPAERHKAITKKARKTNHIERFNNTLRQRLSRLVRESLAFSKQRANHIGAIKFFICHYNLEKAAALPL
jgi:hypothetical protein